MIRLGTRGSALALAQAQLVATALGEDIEIVTITTAGDRGDELNDKSRWTSALERALLDGEIDIAVHSAKDVPGDLADGTAIAAIPARAGALDALSGFAEVASITPGARVGTSSIRRTAQFALDAGGSRGRGAASQRRHAAAQACGRRGGRVGAGRSRPDTPRSRERDRLPAARRRPGSRPGSTDRSGTRR